MISWRFLRAFSASLSRAFDAFLERYIRSFLCAAKLSEAPEGRASRRTALRALSGAPRRF
jgi:hypothetical protein